MSAPQERPLHAALNKRRLDLDLEWNDVAEQLGISPESLRAIRAGRSNPSERTAHRIDNWMRWQPGSTAAVLAGAQPIPLEPEEARRVAALEGLSTEEGLAYAERLMSDLEETLGAQLGDDLRTERDAASALYRRVLEEAKRRRTNDRY
jgi:transcriptional regulator with XRE-family HTH domain